MTEQPSRLAKKLFQVLLGGVNNNSFKLLEGVTINSSELLGGVTINSSELLRVFTINSSEQHSNLFIFLKKIPKFFAISIGN
jgi:hypothetical protein